LAIAKEAGFSVTQAELMRVHANHIQNLSDEELESVSGGSLVGAAVILGAGIGLNVSLVEC